MEQTRTQALPEPIVVDRSPELARNAVPYVPVYAGGFEITLDASDGTRGDGAGCPLARGFLAHGFTDPKIDGERATVTGPSGRMVTVTLGTDVVEWIGKFDRGENPPPLTVLVSDAP
jgi:hypothetical protein